MFHELGAEVITIGCEPNGFNINDKVGATAPQALVEAVRRSTAPTTASRSTATPTACRWSTRSGRCYDGDELLYAVVADRLARGPGGAGRGRHADDQHGGRAGAARRAASTLVRAKVGDRYVLEELLARGWQLGGENSGHLLALDDHTTGDGIVSALQVLQAVRRTGTVAAGAARRRPAVPAGA